ncbi:MAG: AAA family ATPase [Planctomycetota bacterium]
MKSQLEAFKEYIRLKLKPATNTISVISGKGGVGKTNFVANLGLILNNFGLKVLLVDFDLGLSNLDILLNMGSNERRFNLAHYLEGKVSLEQIITRSKYGVDIIIGALGDEKVVNMNSVERDKLLAQLDNIISEYNFVILDMGAGIAENTIKLSLCADNIVLITTPEPHALLSAYGTLKVLKDKLSQQSVFLVVNNVKNKLEGDKLQNGFIDTVYKYLNIIVEPLGNILYDPQVVSSVKEKIPFVINYPTGWASECLNAIATRMCTKLGVNITLKKRSFFSKLFKSFL